VSEHTDETTANAERALRAEYSRLVSRLQSQGDRMDPWMLAYTRVRMLVLRQELASSDHE